MCPDARAQARGPALNTTQSLRRFALRYLLRMLYAAIGGVGRALPQWIKACDCRASRRPSTNGPVLSVFLASVPGYCRWVPWREATSTLVALCPCA
ncbi:hypothetical protein H920_04772 [Fukomys damarensis]|uniref:Uncharacterized protein n=1 Tax=Fukomys damarensis TaxID=885580 RepID=A0A091DTJ5_FUKDA|nr:hypothetical protein H920_04772 [Fukomys damarensis]